MSDARYTAWAELEDRSLRAISDSVDEMLDEIEREYRARWGPVDGREFLTELFAGLEASEAAP